MGKKKNKKNIKKDTNSHSPSSSSSSTKLPNDDNIDDILKDIDASSNKSNVTTKPSNGDQKTIKRKPIKCNPPITFVQDLTVSLNQNDLEKAIEINFSPEERRSAT